MDDGLLEFLGQFDAFLQEMLVVLIEGVESHVEIVELGLISELQTLLLFNLLKQNRVLVEH